MTTLYSSNLPSLGGREESKPCSRVQSQESSQRFFRVDSTPRRRACPSEYMPSARTAPGLGRASFRGPRRSNRESREKKDATAEVAGASGAVCLTGGIPRDTQ